MVTVASSLDGPMALRFPRPSRPDRPQLKDQSLLGLGDVAVPGIVIGLALRFDIWRHYLAKQRRKSRSDSTAKSSNDQTTPTKIDDPTPADHDPDSTLKESHAVKEVEEVEQKEKEVEEEVIKAPYIPPMKGSANVFWTMTWFSRRMTDAIPDQGQFSMTYFYAGLVGYIGGLVATFVNMHRMKHAQPALLFLAPFVLAAIWLTALVRGELKLLWAFTEKASDEEMERRKKKEEREKKEREEKERRDANLKKKGGKNARVSKPKKLFSLTVSTRYFPPARSVGCAASTSATTAPATASAADKDGWKAKEAGVDRGANWVGSPAKGVEEGDLGGIGPSSKRLRVS